MQVLSYFSSVNLLGVSALAVSVVALVSSIALPLYLAKRAETFTIKAKDKDRLSPFYRKVKEFAVHANTPGIGFNTRDLYYLSNDAGELGQNDMKELLLTMFNDATERDGLPFYEEGSDKVNPKVQELGKKFQQDLRLLHDLAESKNSLIN